MDERMLYIPIIALERKNGHKSEKDYRKEGHDVDPTICMLCRAYL